MVHAGFGSVRQAAAQLRHARRRVGGQEAPCACGPRPRRPTLAVSGMLFWNLASLHSTCSMRVPFWMSLTCGGAGEAGAAVQG